MPARDLILSKQLAWADQRGIRLGGQFRFSPDRTQVERGEKSYVYDLNDNLFQQLSHESREEFLAGAGGELSDKMFAVHSSSALCCNLFHYWRGLGFYGPVASACELPEQGIETLAFEAQFQIDPRFRTPPNVDVAFSYAEGSPVRCAAIESKFAEPYDRRNPRALDRAYLVHCKALWQPLPATRQLAVEIERHPRTEHLCEAQLVTHVLGLTKAYGVKGFSLVYLWYEVADEAAYRHREEIDRFATVMERDDVRFHVTTYQEVIAKLSATCEPAHRAYVNYLTSRYC